MQARHRSLEAVAFRPSKARRVSESSLSAGSRAHTMALWGRLGPATPGWPPLEVIPSQPGVPGVGGPYLLPPLPEPASVWTTPQRSGLLGWGSA